MSSVDPTKVGFDLTCLGMICLHHILHTCSYITCLLLRVVAELTGRKARQVQRYDVHEDKMKVVYEKRKGEG